MSQMISADNKSDSTSARPLDALSGPTRQTRTALMFSLSTLFVYSFLSIPNGSEEIALNGELFSIPAKALFWLLLAATTYFLVSFALSGLYEIRRFEYFDRLRNIRGLIQEHDNSVRKFERRFYDVVHGFNKQFSEIESWLKRVDVARVRVLSNNDSTLNSVCELLERLQQFYEAKRHGEAKEFVGVLDNLYLKVQQMISTQVANTKRWESTFNNEEKALQGLSRMKNSWLDFWFPILTGLIGIIGSLIAHLTEFTSLRDFFLR